MPNYVKYDIIKIRSTFTNTHKEECNVKNGIVRVTRPLFVLEKSTERVKCSMTNIAKKVENGWKIQMIARSLTRHPMIVPDSNGMIKTQRITTMKCEKGVWIIGTRGIDYYYFE